MMTGVNLSNSEFVLIEQDKKKSLQTCITETIDRGLTKKKKTTNELVKIPDSKTCNGV